MIILIVLVALLVIALIASLLYVGYEYSRFVLAANALSELAEAIDTAFTEMGTTLANTASRQVKIIEDMNVMDQEATIIRLIQGIHSEVLNVKQLQDLFTKIDELKKSDTSGGTTV